MKVNYQSLSRNSATEKFVIKARQKYSLEWATSSKTYEELGFYNWCLNSIKGKSRVLEIGCGVGVSTIEIINDNHVVVSIEENPFMIEAAERNLLQSNIAFKSFKRENLVSTDQGYLVDYSNLHESIDALTNVIIEGNLLTDVKLHNWLDRNPPFDAVVCWFMGVQCAIATNEDMRNIYGFNDYEPTRYRQHIQVALCKIGDMVLKPGGVINFIDRTQLYNSKEQSIAELEILREAVRQLKTSIDICYIDQLEVDDLTKIKGVPIRMTQNSKFVEDSADNRFAITSIVGIKE